MMNVGTCRPTEEVVAPQIANALNGLGRQIDILNDIIERLNHRLSPALREIAVIPNDNPEKAGIMVPLAAEIARHELSLIVANDRLSSILERCEL